MIDESVYVCGEAAFGIRNQDLIKSIQIRLIYTNINMNHIHHINMNHIYHINMMYKVSIELSHKNGFINNICVTVCDDYITLSIA